MPDDNIVDLNSYRAERYTDPSQITTTDDEQTITIVLAGLAAEEIRREAERDQTPLPKFVGDAISLGVLEAQLLREGWEGPVWQRARKIRSGITHLFRKINPSPAEYIITRRTPKE